MEDLYGEPLNLVKKKKPIAVVAPSPVNEDSDQSTMPLAASIYSPNKERDILHEQEEKNAHDMLHFRSPLWNFQSELSRPRKDTNSPCPWNPVVVPGGYTPTPRVTRPIAQLSQPPLHTYHTEWFAALAYLQHLAKLPLVNSSYLLPPTNGTPDLSWYFQHPNLANFSQSAHMMNAPFLRERSPELGRSANSEDTALGKSRSGGKKTSSRSSVDHKHSSNDSSKLQDACHNANSQDKKKPHIKKPLNAFMLYMKEMRAKVVAECTLKESAAINQILGRRWHALGREEQAKYYELARRERQIHMQLYPDWSSRANTTRIKKRKKKQETHDGGNNMKKCRARYGLDQQNQWCKPCRRKKRCVRYVENGGDSGNQSEEVNSCGSVDARSPGGDDDSESFPHSASSPGTFSYQSGSLTSPSVILPSPNTSQTSPSVSQASPSVNSMQSPLNPHTLEYDCSISKPPPPPCLPSSFLLGGSLGSLVVPQPSRHPVGTNPHDINNPLSVNQLTGKCNNDRTPAVASC